MRNARLDHRVCDYGIILHVQGGLSADESAGGARLSGAADYERKRLRDGYALRARGGLGGAGGGNLRGKGDPHDCAGRAHRPEKAAGPADPRAMHGQYAGQAGLRHIRYRADAGGQEPQAKRAAGAHRRIDKRRAGGRGGGNRAADEPQGDVFRAAAAG